MSADGLLTIFSTVTPGDDTDDDRDPPAPTPPTDPEIGENGKM